MRHLRSVTWGVVHGHSGLISSVDRFVAQQSSRRNHRSGHSISDEDDDVVRFPDRREIENLPVELRLHCSVVRQNEGVVSGSVDSEMTIRSSEHVDKSRRLCVSSRKILEIGEIVRFGYESRFSE